MDNKKYFGVLEGIRIKIMELFTLYVIWIGENYEEDEIRELFSKSEPCPNLKKGFEYIGYTQNSGLTEVQAIVLLDLFYSHLQCNYSPKKIAEFFKHRKLAKPDDPFFAKVYKPCRHCGRSVCFHKAKGLCNLCYHKLFVEPYEK